MEEETLRDRLPTLNTEAKRLSQVIATERKDLENLLPKSKEDHARKLLELEQACTAAEGRLEGLQRRRKLLDDLRAEVGHMRQTREPKWHSELQRRFADAPLTAADWNAFRMAFIGDVDAVLVRHMKTLDEATARAKGDSSTPTDLAGKLLAEWPLSSLRAARDAAKKDVGIDAQQQQKYDALQRALKDHEASLRRVEADVTLASGAADRRTTLIGSRRQTYRAAFETIIEEEDILRRLYAPLQESLLGASGALAKLQLVVRREVDLSAWVAKGEGLLDLRRESSFRGQGALEKEVTRFLLRPWTSGTADDVAAAIDSFRTAFWDDFRKARPATVQAAGRGEWYQSLADWFYDASHIRVEYGIAYDGVAIEQLSPGTRGIVLLLLYLAIDQQDRRPLLVDQPEENLDPNSVFEELVPHFRAARRRRQIVIVTHNANLVVNTDADQVIIAESQVDEHGGLPKLSYRSGGLEDAEIRSSVCQLLEGGERAFLERERRYRLRWGEFG